MLKQAFPDEPQQDLDAVASVLQQFESRDQSSTVFRYPIDGDSLASVAAGERIDILQVGDTANGVINLLDAFASTMRDYLGNVSNDG